METKKYLDVLNVLACFLVIWDHVNGTFFGFSTEPYWIITAVIHMIVNPGVPIFAMITGTTLLGYREKYSTSVFVKKRIRGVVIPFLIWSVVYMLFRILWGEYTFDLKTAIDGIMHTKFNPIFWFFYPLFGAYLAIPIFSAIRPEVKKKVFQYCIAAFYFFGLFCPYLFRQKGLSFHEDIQFNVVSGFLFYCIVGYCIDRYEIGKKWRMLMYAGGIGCVIYNILDCIILSYQYGYETRHFDGCFTLTYTMMAIPVFLFFKYLDPKKLEFLHRLIRPFRKATFGIYLIQIIFLYYFVKWFSISTEAIWYILLGEIPLFFACAGAVLLLKKVPGVKHII